MTESRLEPARRRAAGAKRLLTGIAAVSFAAALLLVRGTHTGQATTHAQPASVADSGSTVLASSGAGAVQVQTHVS